MISIYDANIEVITVEALFELRKYIPIKDWHFNGSVAINGKGNDIDIVVLLGGDKVLEFGMLDQAGFEHCGAESYKSCGAFDAYRYGDVNFILCDDQEYYTLWKVAKSVCQYLVSRGLDDRDTRVEVFKRVLYGEI